MNFDCYRTEGYFDECFEADGQPRPAMVPLKDRIESLPKGELMRRQKSAEAAMFQLGITFSVYGEKEQTERIFPFDIMPRIIAAREWVFIESGLKQRIRALNLFIHDVY